ncbi:hypothetical protein RJT34_01167 [Clitoria ternatea]|uniref:USP domain-containing protein n=1 Tax=Clitoria ternatea TaxID=43366 RepID=A0AAN9KIQ4_CLITE
MYNAISYKQKSSFPLTFFLCSIEQISAIRNKGKGDKENEGSTWYQASDAYVREVSLDEVLRCEAYILFYDKI